MNVVEQGVLAALAKGPHSRFPMLPTFTEDSHTCCESSSYWARSQSLVTEYDKDDTEEDDDRPDW